MTDTPTLFGVTEASCRRIPKTMNLHEWSSLVDERLVLLAPALHRSLRGKDLSGKLDSRAATIVFQRPVWRGPRGFITVWPSSWPADDSDERARVTYFRWLPFGHGGNPEAEGTYDLSRTDAERAARHFAGFLAPEESREAWSLPANLRGRRSDDDSFLGDLVHEMGHAVGYETNGVSVQAIVVEGIEVRGESVRALGAHTIWYVGSLPIENPAIGAVAGIVSERLFTDRAVSFADPIGTFIADPSCYSDLEESIAQLLASQSASAMDLRLINERLREAMKAAESALRPRIPGIVDEALRWRQRVVADRSTSLVIPFDDRLRAALRLVK